jgi:hypothetical protein
VPARFSRVLAATAPLRYREAVRSESPPNESDEVVAVSPRHSVRISQDYAVMVQRAPGRDLVVRTIARREANGLPLMSADIVIAGYETREKFPAARTYPLHFRKTYYPGRLHGDPRDEFERQREAAALIGLPEPIGYTYDTFRTCLLPGSPYARLSPFGVEPEESNLALAHALPLASAAGLWRMLESAFAQLQTLHAAGLAHGDAELHNFIVCPSPLEIVMIDFEAAVRRDAVSEEVWEATCRKDLVPVLREAVFLQCALGPQPGALAQVALERIAQTLKHPDRFRRELGHAPDMSG